MTETNYRGRRTILAALPDRAFTRALSKLASRRIPKLVREPFFGIFAKLAGARVDEASHPLSSYPTWDAFFTRTLTPGARPIETNAQVVSPCDGRVAAVGQVTDGRLFQVKGLDYALDDLLGIDDPDAWEGAHYVTIYLSPANYHRVHAPCEMGVHRVNHFGGAILPVNPWSVAAVQDLFSRNERVVFHFGTGALVMVGATGVSAISVAGGPALSTRHNAAHHEIHRFSPPRAYAQGNELGTFHLGSTVVLIWKDTPPPTVTVGAPITLGTRLFARA